MAVMLVDLSVDKMVDELDEMMDDVMVATMGCNSVVSMDLQLVAWMVYLRADVMAKLLVVQMVDLRDHQLVERMAVMKEY